jgi:vacuolar protein sorting-associated protein IST1
MAELLALGKEESARIRVENIIREDIYIELMEMIELYCELLLARIVLLDNKECDSGLTEAVKTIIYAAPHTDIKELQMIREMLVHKFGPEFTHSAMTNEDNVIPEKITKRIGGQAPSSELVSLYLQEIARAYNVPFSELSDHEGDSFSDEEGDDEGGKPILLEDPVVELNEPETTSRKLSASNLPEPGQTSHSPISVRPPAKTSDNPHPIVKIPDDMQKNVVKKKHNGDFGLKKKGDNDFDALRKRFEALKR